MFYKCECGKTFENKQSFLGHKSNCDIHLKSVGKNFWTKDNKDAHRKKKIIEKYGSLEEYSRQHSESIKKSFEKRTDTFNYKIKNIDKEEFVNDYLVLNNSRKYMMDKYNVKSYMLDKIIDYFDCHKSKKQAAKLSWATKYEIYPSDNINNWQKGQQTRITNYGTLEESYKQGLIKQKQTMVERYGVENPLCLDYLSTHRKKKFTKPNNQFAKILDNNGIKYEREFVLETKSYDFKVGNFLIEINPTVTHNTYYIPYGNKNGLDENYHKIKTDLANKYNYRCIHVWDWDDEVKIVNLLSKREKVYARDCVIKEVDKQTVKTFLNKYHLQGYAKDTIRLGLFNNEKLVSVMTFGKPRYNKNYEYELIRLCSPYYVVGGEEKLFNYFTTKFTPKSIISYCDKSKFEGKVYHKLGFTSTGTTLSRHWYNPKTNKHITDNLLRQRGFDQLFGNQYGYYGKSSSNDTIMLAHGFLPVIDSGQETFIWKLTGK